MRSFSPLLALAAPLLVAAAPVRRDIAPTDALVLQFANVLENLETQFYMQGLKKFQASDFQSAGFQNPNLAGEILTGIMNDEASHGTTLSSVITSFGQTPLPGCSFNFGSALDNVANMAATARAVEYLGVTAYLGAAHLISDPVILTAAGSILTIEARHQTMLNMLSGTATTIPQSYDLALTPPEVLASAAPLISGCDLGVKPNPSLAITNTGAVTAGTALTFKSDAISGDTSKFSCQMMTGGVSTALVLPFDQCVVPQGINGPVAIWITNDPQPLLNNVRDRATVNQVAGPAIAFIDANSQQVSTLVRTVANAAPDVTTTATVSPAQASGVASSGSGTPTNGAPVPAVSPGSMVMPAGPGAQNDTNIDATLTNKATGPSTDGNVIVNGWTFPQQA